MVTSVRKRRIVRKRRRINQQVVYGVGAKCFLFQFYGQLTKISELNFIKFFNKF